MSYILPDPRFEMPELFIPNKKPAGPLVVDWSKSLTRGLIGAYIFNEWPILNIVNGFNGFAPDGGDGGGGALTATSKGLAGTWDATGGDSGTDPALTRISEDYSIIMFVNARLNTSDSYAAMASLGNGSSDIFRFQRYNVKKVGDLWRWRIADPSLGAFPDHAGGNATWNYHVARCKPTSTSFVEVYDANGAVLDTGSVVGTGAPTAPTVITFGTQAGDTSLVMDQDMAFCYVWNRQISSDEAKRLIKDNYQFLIPA